MRQIKFRAWDKENKKMSQGIDLLDVYPFWRTISSDDEPIFMQFTNLKDKNGKEIYEGDIVSERTENYYRVGEVTYGETHARYYLETPREWANSHNLPGGSLIEDMSSLNSKYWEVIGNIYENPELLSSNK